MSNSLVSFVVLNWNGLEDTLKCLDSLRNQTYKNYEIIVVDNGSSSEQKRQIATVSDIVLIDLPYNTGFTGGQIAAEKIAKGDYLALINNDSVIAPNWCEEALNLFESDKDHIGVMGGRAYEWNEELGYKPYSTSNNFYSYQIVNPKNGHTTTLKTGRKVTSVNSISGSAVMINRSVVSKVGYFDDRFFAYYEETDLFARMKRAGYKVLYSPKLETWHKIAQSTRSNPGFYLYYMHRNRFIFAIKNYDFFNALQFLGSYIKEFFISSSILIRYGRKSGIEHKMMVKAGWWNITHLFTTLSARSRSVGLGKTYSRLLHKDSLQDISIVIPCYNYAQFVAEAINSAAEQSLSPSEIIIIDDGSTDNSLAVINKVVKELQNKYPDILFNVFTQNNSGIISTKNVGIDKVNSQWTIFLDADDILDKRYVEKCFNKQKDSNADVVYTDMKMFGAVELTQTVLTYNKFRIRSVNIIHNSALYRTALLKQVNGYSPELSIGYEDWELNLKLSKVTDRFQYLAEPLLLYRRHEGASRDNNAQQKIAQVVKILERLHPDLYNLRFYWWLETNTVISHVKYLVKYPFLMLKHTYFHTIMGLDRHSKKSSMARIIVTFLRKLKTRGKRHV